MKKDFKANGFTISDYITIANKLGNKKLIEQMKNDFLPHFLSSEKTPAQVKIDIDITCSRVACETAVLKYGSPLAEVKEGEDNFAEYESQYLGKLAQLMADNEDLFESTDVSILDTLTYATQKRDRDQLADHKLAYKKLIVGHRILELFINNGDTSYFPKRKKFNEGDTTVEANSYTSTDKDLKSTDSDEEITQFILGNIDLDYGKLAKLIGKGDDSKIKELIKKSDDGGKPSQEARKKLGEIFQKEVPAYLKSGKDLVIESDGTKITFNYKK